MAERQSLAGRSKCVSSLTGVTSGLKGSPLPSAEVGRPAFFTSLVLYVAAFLLAVASWLKWPAELGRAAFRLMTVAFLLATAGIVARMWLEGRPPVTNLYSSALFIGWGSVALCLVLERLNR